MDAEKWPKVRGILEEVIGEREDRRDALLEARCGGDSSLRAAVRSLVRAYDDASRNFQSGDVTVPEQPSSVLSPGLSIGPYVIQALIGEGGFGQVYRAEQLRPVRRDRVALKVIKLGMDTRHILARFEAERQVLALMSHANIAKIFDAGTTPDGRPYFVMEHIAGIPVTDYCDRRRLGVEDRLRLFILICEAVQHAHQKGIIHRDIKPRNVLVSDDDGRATPKVIDFGVAKALDRPLTEGTFYTERGVLVGTPEYMSPEQVEPTAQDIDTRSDIYALGVLLYELLTGTRPFDRARLFGGKGGLRETIRDVVPPRPSRRLGTLVTSNVGAVTAAARARRTDARALRRRLRGDLDRITMMCLEKDRARRYGTAVELARDVERHLSNEPVRAAPPEIGYRLRKFLVRRRWPVAAAAVVLLVVAVAAGQAIGRARLARQQARTEAELGRRQARDLVEEARLLAYVQPGDAREKLESAAAKDPGSAGPPLEMARLRALGSDKNAALDEARRVVARFPDSGEAAALLAGLLRGRDPEQSRSYRDQAEGLLQSEERSATKARSRLLFALAFGEDDPDEAIRMFSESLELDPWSFETLWQRATRRFSRALDRRGGRDIGGALEDLDGALEDAGLMVKVRDDLAMTWIQQGAALMERAGIMDERARTVGDPVEAQRLQERGRADLDAARLSLDRAVEREPENWMGYFNRALLHGRAAGLRQRDGDLTGRRDELRKGLEDLDRAVVLQSEESRIFVEKQRFHFDLGEYEAAATAATRAIESGETGYAIRHDRGTTLVRTDDYEEAAADFTAALESMAADAPAAKRAEILDARSHALLVLGRYAEAREDAERSIALDPGRTRAHLVLGKALLHEGRRDLGIEHVDRAVTLAPERSRSLYCLERGIAHWKLGRDDRALRDFTAFAELPGPDGYWIRLWIWEIERLRGNDVAAARALEAASRSDDRLLALVIRSIRGEAVADEVVTAAGSDSERLYVLYYLGVAAFVGGRDTEAADWFERSTRVGLRDWMEHELAVWHLERLKR